MNKIVNKSRTNIRCGRTLGAYKAWIERNKQINFRGVEWNNM